MNTCSFDMLFLHAPISTKVQQQAVKGEHVPPIKKDPFNEEPLTGLIFITFYLHEMTAPCIVQKCVCFV
jgi:hypothetical protein